MKFCKCCKDYLQESSFGRRSNVCKECKKLGTKSLPVIKQGNINTYAFAPLPTVRAETVEDWPREGFPNVLHYM